MESNRCEKKTAQSLNINNISFENGHYVKETLGKMHLYI